MNIYDIWPYFGILAVLLVLFSAPVFKFIDGPPTHGRRVLTLDGLRGFLALSVFVHHGVVNYLYLRTDAWIMPPTRFYGVLGQVGVAYFFMISGFLFWAKLLREQKRINWIALYAGRMFRIAPVYYVAIFSMFLIVFIRTDFTLHEPGLKVAQEMLTWLGLMLFGKANINGVWTQALMSMTWTLHFEWLFYFSLMLTYIFAIQRKGLRLAFVLAGLGVSMMLSFVWHGAGITYTAFFFSGMTAATLIHDGIRPKINPHLGAAAVFACMVMLLQCFDEIHNGFAIALLALSFYIICLGNNLFGLLTCAAAQRLGHISYGIYLMQGIVLAVFYWSGVVKSFAYTNDAHYWLTVMLCAVALTLLAAALYACIERPGIALGRKVGGALTVRKEEFTHYLRKRFKN